MFIFYPRLEILAPMATIKVLLVEDDPFTRSTLSGALSQEGFLPLDPAGSVSEAIESFSKHEHDVLVVDLDLGVGPTGIDLINLIRRSKPKVGSVVLTSFEDPRLLRTNQALLPQNTRYLVKQSVLDVSQISSAIYDSLQVNKRQPAETVPTPTLSFTDVQLETMRLLAAGHSNSEIAKKRFVSEKTVEKSIKLIAEQMGLAPAPTTNLRVAIARTYLRLTGGKG